MDTHWQEMQELVKKQADLKEALKKRNFVPSNLEPEPVPSKITWTDVAREVKILKAKNTKLDNALRKKGLTQPEASDR